MIPGNSYYYLGFLNKEIARCFNIFVKLFGYSSYVFRSKWSIQEPKCVSRYIDTMWDKTSLNRITDHQTKSRVFHSPVMFRRRRYLSPRFDSITKRFTLLEDSIYRSRFIYFTLVGQSKRGHLFFSSVCTVYRNQGAIRALVLIRKNQVG